METFCYGMAYRERFRGFSDQLGLQPVPRVWRNFRIFRRDAKVVFALLFNGHPLFVNVTLSVI
jgi:hypothetical protein